MSKLYGVVGEKYAVVGESANLCTPTTVDGTEVNKSAKTKKGRATKKAPTAKETKLGSDGEMGECAATTKKKAKRKRAMASEGLVTDVDIAADEVDAGVPGSDGTNKNRPAKATKKAAGEGSTGKKKKGGC